MSHGWIAAAVSFAALAAAPISSFAAALTAQQITNDAINQEWSNRASSLSRGKILWLETDGVAIDTVFLYDGVAKNSVQTRPGFFNVETAVFHLGSGLAAGQVIAGWRRGTEGNVSDNGGPPAPVAKNPEGVSISDGCMFMILQDGTNGNHAYKIETNGTFTQISSGIVEQPGNNKGTFGIVSSKCKAAWMFDPKGLGNDPTDLQFWNGLTSTTLDTNINAGAISMADGRIVYVKTVGGFQKIFAVDTNVSLIPFELYSEADATRLIERPQTDGRHVAWYRNSTGATNDQIMFYGGAVLPVPPVAKIELFGSQFQLNRGQLLWKDKASGNISYDDGRRTYPLSIAPASSIERPWLTDGNIVFLGLSSDAGLDKEVFRITGTPPSDASQPAPPMLLTATPGAGQVTLTWDRVLGTGITYNLYIANEPGVTRDNYLSLLGGRKITNVTSPYVVTPLATTDSYSFTVTTVEGASEGPSGRVATATLIGTLTWQAVGGMSSTIFYSAAEDQANFSFVYAGSNGTVFKSSNGGINWTPALTGLSRVVALASDGPRVFANLTQAGDIWRSTDSGGSWSRVVDAPAGLGEGNGSLAISGPNVYAGDFQLSTWNASLSYVLKSADGGTSWAHTPEGPGPSDNIRAYTIAIDPANPNTLYAGGSGNPWIAKSINAGASWIDLPFVPVNGGVYSIAVDGLNPDVVYATTRDKGVFKSIDGGVSWTAKNSGIGVPASGTGFNSSIVIDRRNPNYLHLGWTNGYYYSIDGGENWIAANSGFAPVPFFNGIAVTPARRVIAATDTGLYVLTVGPPPVLTSISPNSDSTSGGAAVTLTGTGFQPGATVTIGGAAATSVVVVNFNTISAIAPAGSAGAANVTVTNFDGRSSTLTGGFTFNAASMAAPTGVNATAQTLTSIQVTWNSVPSATSYQVVRQAPGAVLTTINAGNVTSFFDTVSANSAYLYRVRAVGPGGTSANSSGDIATTVTYDPVAPGNLVQAAHLAQPRAALDAVRQLAGASAAAYTDAASPGVVIKAVHVGEIRAQLDAALATLGLPWGSYTDPALTGATVKAAHFQEIRNRVR